MDAKYELKIYVMGKVIKARVQQNEKMNKIITMLRQKQIIKNNTIDNQIKIINRHNYRQLTFNSSVRQFQVCQLSGIREVEVRVSNRYKQVFDDVLYQEKAEQIRLKCINYLLQNKQDNAKGLLSNKNFSFKYLELLQQLKKGQNKSQQNNEKIKPNNQYEQLYKNQLIIQEINYKNQLQIHKKTEERLKNQINATFNYLMEMVESDTCTQMNNKDQFSPEAQGILDYIYHNISKLKTESKIRQIKQSFSQKQVIEEQKLQIQKTDSKISDLEQPSLQSSQKKSEISELKIPPPPLSSVEMINKNLIQSIQEYSKRKVINTKSQFSINAPNNDLVKKINDKNNFILKFFVNEKLFGLFSLQPMGKLMKSQKGFLFTFIDSKIEVFKPKPKQILWKKSQIDILIGQKVIQIQKNLKVNRKKEINTAFDCRQLTNVQIFGTDDRQFMLTNLQLMTVQFNQFELLQSSQKSIKQEKGSNLKKEE